MALPEAEPSVSYLRRMLALLRNRRTLLTGVLASSLALSLLALIAPRLTQLVFDRVLPTGDFSLLSTLLLILLLVTAVQTASAVWRRLALVRLSLDVDDALLGELSAHLLSLPMAFFHGRSSGDLVARFNDHQHVR